MVTECGMSQASGDEGIYPEGESHATPAASARVLEAIRDTKGGLVLEARERGTFRLRP